MGGEECYTKDKRVIIALCIRWWDIFLLFLLVSYLLFLLILRGRLVSFARKLWKINWRGIQANVENSGQILKSKGTRAQNNKTVTSFIVVNFEKVKVFLLLNGSTCSTFLFHFRFNLTKTRSRICYLIRGHPLFEPKLDLSRMVKEITKCPRVYRRAAYVRHISAEATHFQVVGSEQGWESQDFLAWAASERMHLKLSQFPEKVECSHSWTTALSGPVSPVASWLLYIRQSKGTNSLAHKFSETESRR